MTVQNQPNKFTLNGDGTNKVFPFTNLRLIDVEDLDVYIIDSLGNQTLQVVGVDYTLTQYMDVKDIADPKLKEKSKAYLKIRNYLTKYIKDNKNDRDIKELQDTIDDEGLEYAMRQYHDSSEFSDRKFKKIFKLYNKAADEIESYTGKE